MADHVIGSRDIKEPRVVGLVVTQDQVDRRRLAGKRTADDRQWSGRFEYNQAATAHAYQVLHPALLMMTPAGWAERRAGRTARPADGARPIVTKRQMSPELIL